MRRSPRPRPRPRLGAVLRASVLLRPQSPGRPGDPGLFGPGSVAWVVGRERVGLAGANAALLLQLAHPLVAAGVADHSRFRADPYGRLRGTLQATLTALFGDTDQARLAARRVSAAHRRVHGTLAAPAAPYPAGARYDADDVELGRWVHASLVAVLLDTRELMVGRLGDAARARGYEELKTLGALFGVPEAMQPATVAEFDAYLDAMAAGLTVTDEARAMAACLLDPPRPLLLGPAARVARLLTAELLPEPLRRAYGLPDGPAQRAARAALAATARALIRAVPPRLRFWPHYRTARARLAAPS